MSYYVLYRDIAHAPTTITPTFTDSSDVLIADKVVIKLRKQRRINVVRGDIRKLLYNQALDELTGEGWKIQVESKPDPNVGK